MTHDQTAPGAARSGGASAEVPGIAGRDYRAVVNAHQEILEPLHLWLLTRGVYAYPRGAFAISTAMAERDVDQAAEAVGAGLEALRPYVQQVAPELLAR